ncbi:MAG: MerR family transcriptional regulator [Clostridia bacterium]|nr:MerR family transcriptional regulator [Clostridia bacterium]
MDMPKLFQIGDVAKLFNISVSSLRHYERIGLLVPEYIDPESGYRYYSTRQFEPLNTIRYLRALDMPLSEIADFLQNRDIDLIEEKLRKQKEEVIEKQKKLCRIERKIDNRLRQIEDARSSEFDVVKVSKQPASRAVIMEDTLRIENMFDMETPIRKLEQSQAQGVVFLGKVGVGISKEHLSKNAFGEYDVVFLILDREDEFNGKVSELSESHCASLRFCGSHGEAPVHYRKLMEYINNNGFEVSGFSREITMIDYGITNDTEKFVTEISIPIK